MYVHKTLILLKLLGVYIPNHYEVLCATNQLISMTVLVAKPELCKCMVLLIQIELKLIQVTLIQFKVPLISSLASPPPAMHVSV